MGHKKKNKPTGISEIVWHDVKETSVSNVVNSVKEFCSLEDGSTLTDEEIYKLEELAENPFVKLIYCAANDEGYNSF